MCRCKQAWNKYHIFSEPSKFRKWGRVDFGIKAAYELKFTEVTQRLNNSKKRNKNITFPAVILPTVETHRGLVIILIQ
jgi:hypothetical protein